MSKPEPFEEYDPDYDDDCWNCGGEGFTHGCSWDWQCDTWDGDSCLCTRPCEWCHPPKPNPALQQVLREALAEPERCLAPGCKHTRGTVCTYSLCHGRGYGQHHYPRAPELPQSTPSQEQE